METLDTFNREGRERLHPSLTNPNWLVLRKRREIFQKWLERLEGRDLAALDLGGRIQPYRPLLEGRVRCYVAVDLRFTPLVSVVARGEQIPLADASFDLAICTQMLEYVAEPAAVLAEIHRVLKPGGYLMLSVPSVCPQDSEHDRWRFLPASLHQLLAEFASVEVLAEGGSVAGLFRSINACMNIFARYGWVRSLFRYSVFPVVNVAGVLLEKMSGGRNTQFAANYSAFARK
jgi:SAM-dependent methyltransferase